MRYLDIFLQRRRKFLAIEKQEGLRASQYGSAIEHLHARSEDKMSKVDFSSHHDERVSVAIPVFVYGRKEDGDPFQELTRALVVDVTGGLIELESPVVSGLRLLAVNEDTNEDVECSVVYAQGSHSGKTEVRIAFDKPSPNFWGIKFSSGELNLDQSRRAEPRHFIENGRAPVTPEMFRKLMGRTH